MRGRCGHRAWALAVLAALALRGAAAQPALTFSHLGMDDGFSGYALPALDRQGHGFLWVSTQRGVDRYDGQRVRPYAAASQGPRRMPDDDVLSLSAGAGPDAPVWMGTEDGYLLHYNPRTDSVEHVAAFPAAGAVRALAQTPGAVWAGTSTRLVRYDRARGQAEVVVGEGVAALHASPDGTVWAALGRAVVAVGPGRPRFYPLPGGDAPTALAEADGALWIGTAGGHLYRLAPGDTLARRVDGFAGGARLAALGASRVFPGVLWAGTRGRGLAAYDTRTGGARVYTSTGRPGALSQDDVLALVEDDEGVLWVATQYGLNRAVLDPITFRARAVARQGRALTGSVFTLHASRLRPDRVYVSIYRQGLFAYNRRTAQSVRVPGTAGLDRVVALYEDADGTLWIGGYGASLYAVEPARGQRRAYAFPGPVGVVHTLTALPGRPGVLYAATRDGGLYGFDTRRRQFVAHYDTASAPALPGNYAWSASAAARNPAVLYVAFSGGGVARLDVAAGRVTAFRAGGAGAIPGCLPSDDVIVATEAADGSIWAGTYSAGLVHIRPDAGVCRRVAPETLPYSDVSAIHEDARHRLWLATSRGLALYDPARDAVARFDAADGLPSATFHYQAQHRAAGGELLLGGPRGFVIFDPDTLAVDTMRLPTVLVGATAGGRPLARGAWQGQTVTLPYNRSDVRAEVAVLALRQPGRNHYRVRLGGGAWRELGAQPDVLLPALAPGLHHIEIAGAGPGGAWSRQPAILTVRVTPPFWRAWWFWTALGTLFVGLVAGGYHYRIRQLRRVEQTRRRIADDLHDDIGSKISSVALQLDLAARAAGLPDAFRDHIAGLTEQARGVVGDLRDAVWIVDSGRDALADLVARMEQVAPGLAPAARVRFRHDGLAREKVLLEMETRRHLYLFFKEALHNAARHGRPAVVDVVLRERGDALVLTIADDGAGFDVDAPHDGRGLQTLHRRAAALGGRAAVESTPGTGTTVTLDVPGLLRP